jgi:hypothetical protein
MSDRPSSEAEPSIRARMLGAKTCVLAEPIDRSRVERLPAIIYVRCASTGAHVAGRASLPTRRSELWGLACAGGETGGSTVRSTVPVEIDGHAVSIHTGTGLTFAVDIETRWPARIGGWPVFRFGLRPSWPGRWPGPWVALLPRR